MDSDCKLSMNLDTKSVLIRKNKKPRNRLVESWHCHFCAEFQNFWQQQHLYFPQGDQAAVQMEEGLLSDWLWNWWEINHCFVAFSLVNVQAIPAMILTHSLPLTSQNYSNTWDISMSKVCRYPIFRVTVNNRATRATTWKISHVTGHCFLPLNIVVLSHHFPMAFASHTFQNYHTETWMTLFHKCDKNVLKKSSNPPFFPLGLLAALSSFVCEYRKVGNSK